MRFKLIACEIMFREICAVVAGSPHRIDLEFLPKGLHDIGKVRMSKRLYETISMVNEDDYDAILLAYGLCNGGIVGFSVNKIPMVVPRAHDCITLFLGSRQWYQEYFFANGGTYFKTTGWMERGESLNQSLEMMPYYKKLAFIETGIEPNDSFERRTIEQAKERNWDFEKLQGNMTLLRRLVNGDWDDDFLIVPPGKKIRFSYDDDIIGVDNGE
jgi:hypothetical protein